MLQKEDKEKILFFKESVFNVARLIFNYPNRQFHLRELAKITNLSTTAVASAIFNLKKFNIIKIVKTDLTTDIQADLDSDAYVFYKKIFNLYRLERCSLINDLRQFFGAETIVLFGSFAKGEDIEESDVDLLVLTKVKKNIEKFEKPCKRAKLLYKDFEFGAQNRGYSKSSIDETMQDALDKCECELNRKINLHILPSLDKSASEFKNAVANGIVLYGYLKVV